MRNNKSYTTLDYYEYYRQRIDKDSVYDITKEQFQNVIHDYFKYIASEVIDQSKEFKLPCRLGYLSIIKTKPKNFDYKSLKMDYGESKKQGKLILYTNLHSNMYKFRYYWNKNSMMTPNKSKYQFIASRANKRKLAKVIKGGLQDYIEHTYDK